MNSIKLILAVISISLLAACGGGGDDAQPTGTTSMKLIFVLQGNTATSVKGIQATITLPDGVVVRAETSGEVMNGVLTQAADTPSGYVLGKYTAATNGSPATVTIGYTLSFPTTKDFAAGDVMVLNADLLPGVSAPAAGAFIISGSKLAYVDENIVSGASLALR